MHRLLFALLLLLVQACSSTGSGEPKEPVGPLRVAMLDYRSGFEMPIVNDAWLVAQGVPGDDAEARRAAYFSQARPLEDANTKVLSDAQLAAVVRVLEDRMGFLQYSQPGAQPRASGEYSSSIQVHHGDQVRHFPFVVRGQGMSREAQQAYADAKGLVAEAYNYTYSLQTVDDEFEFSRGTGR